MTNGITKEALWHTQDGIQQLTTQQQTDSRNNTKSAMELMWQLLKLTNDVELTEHMLADANHDVTKAVMYLYSMETFIYTAINRASREQDKTKIETLGPYAVLLT